MTVTKFTSKLWLETMRAEQIRAVFSSVHHPQSNIVDWVNKEIGRFLRTLELRRHSTWPTWIDFIQNYLNESYHDTTQFTPMELQTGMKPTWFWSDWINLPPRVDLPYAEKIALVYTHIKSKGETRATRVNANKKLRRYQLGDRVLVFACHFSNASSQVMAKFVSLYEGPYVVCDVYNECTYRNVYPKTNKIRGTFHSTELRPYHEAPPSTIGKEKSVETQINWYVKRIQALLEEAGASKAQCQRALYDLSTTYK